ncbi:MAG: replication protein P [Pseudomonadota bacterium]
MKTVDKVIREVAPNPQQRNAAAYVVNGAKNSAGNGRMGNGGRDHVDAINQIFAEFELAYHNQFHKAYAQEGSLNLAKKYWLSCLADFLPEVILRAARQVIKSQEYLPTVASMVKACENALSLFGLPTPHVAYVEACCAPEPKHSYQWSHPAVYLAGKHTGWFELATETQSAIFPVFEYNYQLLCQQVLRGEQLDIQIPVALPQTISAPLSPEENMARLKVLREKFAL